MEDSANITKALANDLNTFIATLNSDGMGDVSVKAATSKPSNSFALVLQNQLAIKTVKIKELRNDEKVKGAAVVIPLSAVEENSWAKFGLKRMMLDEGFFLFQFETKEGMDKVMETGPWLIRLVLLILNVWTPNTILKKDEIKAAPVWVKLHYVPIVAYSEIVSSETDLMDSIVIAILYSDGKGHTLATIDIERVKHGETSNTQQKGDTSNASKKDHMNMSSSKPQGTGMELKNSFSSLENDEDDLWDQGVSQNALNVINESDSKEVDEESVLKGAHQNARTKILFKGASTPSEQVPHD
ncbi:RNA-directed DNA polymerase, eukaryota [Tanacetum coccineum]